MRKRSLLLLEGQKESMCSSIWDEGSIEVYSIGTFSSRLFISLSLTDLLSGYMSKKKSHRANLRYISVFKKCIK